MNDIRRCLSFNDVLIVPRNSELDHISDAELKIKYEMNHNLISYPLYPIFNAPMTSVCSIPLISYLSNCKFPTTIHRWFSTAQEQIKFYEACKIVNPELTFLSVGTLYKWKEWINYLIDYRNSHDSYFSILVDVAQGDTRTCAETIEYIKSKSAYVSIMAGNVCTRSGFSRLQDAGANFIRVGVGGSSCCATRINCGVGLPTLTSIMDCAKVKDKAYLIADGGINTPGDIVKSMAAGADGVMLGKMLAATSLSNAEKFDKNYYISADKDEWKYVKYSGMASKESISQLQSKKSSVSVEGVTGFIPYTGETDEVMGGILGNLQSAMAYYLGCQNWVEVQKKAKFVEITNAGWNESETRLI